MIPASPEWTGSPEQWANFRANPPRLEKVDPTDAAAERQRRARLARWQAPPLSRGWPDGMP